MPKPLNISIIGAGPVGCYAGYLLAKAGHMVGIYENHSQIGCPIQCTGLLTSEFEEFNLPMDSFIVNTFTGVEVFSPNRTIQIKQKEYLVYRTDFDNFFADLACRAGAKIFLNHSFARKEGKEIIIKDSSAKVERKIIPDLVIAADGPLSPTAKAYGLYHPKRENYFGVQAVVRGDFDPTKFQAYFGRNVCPDLFAWIVPESATQARVGLAMKKNSKAYFDKFMQEHGFSVLEMQAGTIPLYHPAQELQKDNCYVLGDAAGFVKATTLGGLYPGLKQAQILAECLITGKNYQRAIAPLRRRLRLHLFVQKIFNNFSDEDWDVLLMYIAQPRLQKVFEKYTRDNPVPLVLFSLLKEPRLLRFGKYLFRS